MSGDCLVGSRSDAVVGMGVLRGRSDDGSRTVVNSSSKKVC